MSFKPQNMLIEHLLEFCLGRRGIVWKPAPKEAQGANADQLFQDIIGNAVLNTCIKFKQEVHEHNTAIWNDLSNLSVPVKSWDILHRIDAVSDGIIDNEIYESATERTYVVLALMVDVAAQCALNGNEQLIQDFVSVIPRILEIGMSYDLISNFDSFLLYASHHGKPPGSWCNLG